jgi:hypothetical protein
MLDFWWLFESLLYLGVDLVEDWCPVGCAPVQHVATWQVLSRQAIDILMFNKLAHQVVTHTYVRWINLKEQD